MDTLELVYGLVIDSHRLVKCGAEIEPYIAIASKPSRKNTGPKIECM